MIEAENNKSILITGGNGFLASHLSKGLINNSFNKVKLGSRKPIKLKNNLLQYSSFDIADSATFGEAVENTDIVIHLAAMDYMSCLNNSEEANYINVEQVNKLLKVCIDSGVKKFIYFSTFHVYGADIEGQITESTKVKPNSIYAETHYRAENIILDNSDIDSVIIRLTNSFGLPTTLENHSWSLVVNNVCRQAVLNKSIKLSTSGEQYRDFIPASNLFLPLDFLIKKQNLTGIFNLGSELTQTIKEVAFIVANVYKKLTGESIALSFDETNKQINNYFNYKNDNLTKNNFKFSCDFEIEIEKIISKLINYKNLGNYE